MGLANKILPHYTYNDYVNWEGRWELIEGHPIAMSPMPIPEHQRVAAEMRFEFMSALKKEKCKNCRAYDPLDYKINDDTILQPDIVIVCGPINRAYLDFPAELVVEILSPSTALRDRNSKFEFYQQQKIKYYLIVEVHKRSIEIYELTEGMYILQSYNNHFEFQFSDCTILPELNNIWE
jgi:Uma2 family endonuclease